MYFPTLSHISVSQRIVRQQKSGLLDGMNGFYTRSKAIGSYTRARTHAARSFSPDLSAWSMFRKATLFRSQNISLRL